MSIILNDNLDVKAPKPTDQRYGPYATTSAALAGVLVANRYVGLTVGVITGGIIEDYWWNDGTADGDLALKTSGGGGGGSVTSVGATAPVTTTGGTAPVIGMPKATAAVDGYLDNADWATFNGKQAPATTLAGYGITDAYTKVQSDANYPTKAGAGATGTWAISISGVAASASAVAWAGVTGKPTTLAGYGITDAQATLVNQVNIKSINGTSLLGSGDLVVSGGGGSVTGVTATAPVVSSGGTAPVISMPAATAAVNGYLSAANFVIFNGKQAPATTLAGYGITNAYTKTESDANYPTKAGVGATGTWGISISGNAATATAVAWAGITGKPTTLAGYGITDVYTKTESDANYPTKAGAGATGTWAISISGTAAIATVATAVDDLNSANNVKQWIGTQAQYDALGSWDAYTYYAITDAQTPSVPGGGGSVAWDDVTGKPSTYPPSTHVHAIADVTSLQATLDGKAATSHTHTTAQVTGLDTALAGKQATLVSGTNIKTVNGNSLLGSGDLVISGGGGGVTGVTGTAPVVSSGGTAPAISMPAATASVDGYLSAANFTLFNGKQAPATTLAGYGITNAYTKTESDAALALKAPLASPALTGTPTAPTAAVNTNTTQLASTAFVVAQIADDAPTKTGTGASGTWGIGVTGNAATATIATTVDDTGAGTSMKFWYGTEDEFTAIGTKDATTIYFRSA